MSGFWSAYITVITLALIAACYWLIRWTSRRRSGEAVSGEVTGHVWDGDLQELNNPLPRWWLWLFYLTMIFGLVYLALYPGLGNFKGLLGWSEKGQYEQEMRQARAQYGPIFATYQAQPISALLAQPRALQIGQSLFLNYCASCHGSDAHGGRGFPNLADADWLHGGSPAAIEQSILNGRTGVMPAWGSVLGEPGVKAVANYVLSLSGGPIDKALAKAGKPKFAMYCAACHGADGKGNTAIGAPNLTDTTWLYGGSLATVEKTITDGRQGHMPAWRDFLGEAKVHLLAAYVYSLNHPDPSSM